MISRGNGKKPEKHDEVVVHYKGYLEDGSVFDDSHAREDGFKFIIGADHVIKGYHSIIRLLNITYFWKNLKTIIIFLLDGISASLKWK